MQNLTIWILSPRDSLHSLSSSVALKIEEGVRAAVLWLLLHTFFECSTLHIYQLPSVLPQMSHTHTHTHTSHTTHTHLTCACTVYYITYKPEQLLGCVTWPVAQAVHWGRICACLMLCCHIKILHKALFFMVCILLFKLTKIVYIFGVQRLTQLIYISINSHSYL